MSTDGLRASGLCRRFGERVVLAGVDLAVAPGELVAVVGESGSGKSTLLNLLSGLDRADSGQIWIEGTEVTALDEHTRTRRRRSDFGFVFQSFLILPHLTVAQNVELPLVLLHTPVGERNRRARDLLAALGLGDRTGSLPRELSGGELQRVAVARALVHRPAVVLADEPTGNLDADTAERVLELLAMQIHARRAAGVLVTHSATAAAWADRVLVLERGRLAAPE